MEMIKDVLIGLWESSGFHALFADGTFLWQNLVMILVSFVLGLVIAGAIIKMRKDKKKGGCCGGCAGCPSQGRCHSVQNNTKE